MPRYHPPASIHGFGPSKCRLKHRQPSITPKAHPIVRGPKESNESFERMKHILAGSPCKYQPLELLSVPLIGNPTATIPTTAVKVNNNTTVASSPSTSVIPMNRTKKSDPVTPSNMKIPSSIPRLQLLLPLIAVAKSQQNQAVHRLPRLPRMNPSLQLPLQTPKRRRDGTKWQASLFSPLITNAGGGIGCTEEASTSQNKAVLVLAYISTNNSTTLYVSIYQSSPTGI